MTLHMFSRSFLASLTAIISLLVALSSQAQGLNPVGVSVDIRYLVDPTRNLNLEAVLALQPERFHRHDRSDINFGYTRDAVWLRVSIESERDRTVLLSMSPNFVDLIDIYAFPSNHLSVAAPVRHVSTGDHRPLPSDGLSGLDDMLELDLKAGKATVTYVRLAALGSAITTNVQVYAKEDGPRRSAATALVTGVWFGSMGMLVVIQLVFFYYDRRPHYLLLALSTLLAGVVYTGTLGLSRVFLFPEGGMENDVFVSVSVWLGLTASTLAVAYILDLRENNLWLHRLFLAGSVLGLVGAVFGAAGLQQTFAPVGSLASMLLATLAAWQGLRTAKSGGAATQLRAAAYVVFWVGVIAVMVQRTALVDLPNWVAHTYAVACVVQTILLTAALGVRLRAAEALNLVMQQQALAAAKAAQVHANALVEERTRELASARRTAEDALQAELRSQQQQVRFMEVISHQYRTPLAAIRTHVDNIGLSLPKTDEANRSRLERVYKGILRLVEVLEVNLSRARLQGPSFRPVLQRVLVAEVVAAAANRGRDLLQSTIVTDMAPHAADARIYGDADMLGIAIINLLENAEKFSRSRSRQPIRLSCEIGEATAVISVSDKGIGIPASDLPTIFDPARRGSNAHDIEGSGLGLSLVARITAAHGGTIRAESVPGQGTRVAIEIPLSRD